MIVKLKGFAPVEIEDTEVEETETEIIFKDGEGFRAIPKRKIDFVSKDFHLHDVSNLPR